MLFRELKALSDLLDKHFETAEDAIAQERAVEFKSQMLEIEKAVFRMEREHAESMDKLKVVHAEEVSALQHAQARLKSQIQGLESEQ